MRSLAYLTVPDVLWLSLQLAGEQVPFDSVALEEAVFYQYAYGESDELIAQAGRLLTGFVDKGPFERGNEAVALVATAAFLAMNGQGLTVEPAKAVDWARAIWSGADEGNDAIAAKAQALDTSVSFGIPSAQAALQSALQRYGRAAATLLDSEPLAPLA